MYRRDPDFHKAQFGQVATILRANCLKLPLRWDLTRFDAKKCHFGAKTAIAG
jgi:hypothetical protein